LHAIFNTVSLRYVSPLWCDRSVGWSVGWSRRHGVAIAY
jgi:hypothetical protein